ncbi:hypothetical protein [Flavobacterium sp.]|uniref:hypothetical protein n=1 Tax=Flavobacterium sp. TaxID=239 RepID=UPI002FDA1BDA
MKVKDYIIEKINDLVSVFPSLKVSYQIDNYSNSNYIKVIPKKDFESNLEYQKFETELIIEFIEKYPFDEIVFVTDDCLIDIDKPIYEIEGSLFIQNYLEWNSDLWSNEIELDFNLTLTKSVEEIVGNYNSLSDILKSFNNKVCIKPITEESSILEQINEYSYALAA